MSADNYVVTRQVHVTTIDSEFDEWWAWELSASGDYVDLDDDKYQVQFGINKDHVVDRSFARIYLVTKRVFDSEEKLEEWIDDFAVLEYGVSSMDDYSIYRGKPVSK